jgi:GINS complex subunit 2
VWRAPIETARFTILYTRNMSGLTLKSMTTAESEFFAEETLITISPNFSHDKLLFTSGSFGPLEAGDPCVVPLWLAITLRKRGKCTIVIPDWMSTSSLEQNILNEKSRETFEPLPFHYREISQLLLNYARDDIKEPDRAAALLQDIDNIRMDRAKMGMIGSIVYQFSSLFLANSEHPRSRRIHYRILTYDQL